MAKEVRVSSSNNMIAYVAIKRFPGGGAQFAYLPNANIKLPAGWEWNIVDGVIDTDDVTSVAKHMRYTSLEEVCRLMCQGTGVTW